MARIRASQQANGTRRYTDIHSSAPPEAHVPDTPLANYSLLKSGRNPFLPLSLSIFAAGSFLMGGSAAGREDLRVISRPVRPFVELRDGQQMVNFDLLVENSGVDTYRMVGIKLAVFDQNGRLELAREVNENGNPPSIAVIGDRVLPAKRVIDVYQPFYRFDANAELYRLKYQLLFMRDDHRSPPVALNADEIITLDVFPTAYHPALFCPPLRGLVLVHDGHDFYSHHRRYNLSDRFRSSPGAAVSANLYAEDFVSVTADGQLFTGNPLRKENWLSYGQPIFAPADGLVVEVVDDVAENTFDEDGEAHPPVDSATTDPLGLGNHVKIRHADGRISWMLHMKPGSIRVKADDRVRRGELIGKVGFTGDSLFPHLHYNVTNSPTYPSQGMPVYFRSFTYVVGSRLFHPKTGQIDTGDLIRSNECR